ncbi:SDR family oxidoreductase [Rubritalea spongiae]|uniref:SDR family oxidoreductase n=1 Tax=Rubritalea spongiae TaxID=430797 RepID=A0ABW5E0Q3_9BACT
MRRILITGASSGIGKATARALLDAGHEVIGFCRSVEKLPDGVQGIYCDLSEEASVRAAFETVRDQVGEVDVLINNAGIAYLSRISDGDIADWDRMWNVNVRGLALCCQLGISVLNQTSGQIINISSMSGHRVPPTGGFYAPTKFAVRAITESLRAEFRMDGVKIRVASVSPGFVDTPLLDDYFKGREDTLRSTKEQLKMLTAEDISESILHVLDMPLHVEVGDIQLRSVDQKA